MLLLLMIVTSVEGIGVMFSDFAFFSVCLYVSVCPLAYSVCHEWILMKISSHQMAAIVLMENCAVLVLLIKYLCVTVSCY